MVWSGVATPAWLTRAEIGPVSEEIARCPAGAKFEHQAAPGAFDLPIFEAACAAHDRRDRSCRRDVAPKTGDRHGFAVALDKILGERDHLDHALIGFARFIAEGDDAVFAQDEAVARLLALEDFERLLRQAEARHQIRHEGQPGSERVGASLLAVRLIDDAEHSRRMGVVDEFVRQEGVQHDLDRRIWRRRIDKVGALDARQLLVVDRLERARPTQRCEPHGGKTFGLDRRQVRAGGLDAQNLNLFAEAVAHTRLQRGIAAAVQHQLGVAAEKPRGVDAQRQLALDAGFGARRDERFGVTLDPAALHGALLEHDPEEWKPVLRGRAACAPGIRSPVNRRRCASTTTRSGAAGRSLRRR